MTTIQKTSAGVLLLLVIFAAGYGTGRVMVPPKVVEKEVIKEVEKKQDDIHTVTTVVEKPDGTKTTTTVQDDKSRTVDEKSDVTNIAITNTQPQYNISAGVGYDFKNYRPQYMIQAEKKFIGPVSLGIFGVTNGVIGVTVGLSF